MAGGVGHRLRAELPATPLGIDDAQPLEGMARLDPRPHVLRHAVRAGQGLEALPQPLRHRAVHRGAGPARGRRAGRRLPAHEVMLRIGLPEPVGLQLRQDLGLLAALAQQLAELGPRQPHRQVPGQRRDEDHQRRTRHHGGQDEAGAGGLEVHRQQQEQDHDRQPQGQRGTLPWPTTSGGVPQPIHASHCM